MIHMQYAPTYNYVMRKGSGVAATIGLLASLQLAAVQLSTAELPARPVTAGYTMWPGNCCVDGVKSLAALRTLQAKRRLLVLLCFFS